MRLAVRCSTERETPFALRCEDILVKVKESLKWETLECTPHFEFRELGKGQKGAAIPLRNAERSELRPKSSPHQGMAHIVDSIAQC